MVRAYRYADDRARLVVPLARPKRRVLWALGALLVAAAVASFLFTVRHASISCVREGAQATCRAEGRSRLNRTVTSLRIPRFGAIKIERSPLIGLRLVVSSVDGGRAVSAFGRDGDEVALAAHALVEFMDRPSRKKIDVGWSDDGPVGPLVLAVVGLLALGLAHRRRVMILDRVRDEGTLLTRSLGVTLHATTFPLDDVEGATVEQRDAARRAPKHQLLLLRRIEHDLPLDRGASSPTPAQRSTADSISAWLRHDPR